MTIDLRFRRSQWAVESLGSSTSDRRRSFGVERPRESQGSRATATRRSVSIADRFLMRLRESLRRGSARLLAPRERDAASLARRFEQQLPNLAAELRYFAASASIGERRGDR